VEIPYFSEGPGKNSHWFETHPKEDGTPWWFGEVDYLGPCQQARDADCDHWYDTTINPSASSIPPSNNNRDNCPGWWNPDQHDADDDGVGNVCDNCPAYLNPIQDNSSPEFKSNLYGDVKPPVNRVAELNETVGAFYPGDGCRTWTATTPPFPGAICVNNANDIWVDDPANTVLNAYVAHWDGTTWSETPHSSTKQIWGLNGTHGPILHCGDTAWSNVPTPSGGSFADGWGTGPSNIWAVEHDAQKCAALHWDGTAWSDRSNGLPTGCFNSISGTATNDVWMVGNGGSSPSTGYIAHWDGTGWTTAWSKPSLNLTKVWSGRPGDVWVAGVDNTDTTLPQNAWVHLSNGAWTETTAPASIIEITGTAAGDVWAIDGGHQLWHSDGIAPSGTSPPTWTSSPMDSAQGLVGLHATPDGVWAFSGNADLAGVTRLWSRRTPVWDKSFSGNGTLTATATGFRTVAFETTTNGVAVVTDGSTVTSMDLQPRMDPQPVDPLPCRPPKVCTPKPQIIINSAAATPNTAGDDIWAVGQSGRAFHFDGSTWTSSGPGTTRNLNGVSAWASNDVWAVGDGVIFHFDGTSWAQVSDGMGLHLSAVLAAGSNDVWVASLDGVILHWDGSSWSASPTGTSNIAFHALSGAGANVWAVGNHGAALHWDGQAWQFAQGGASTDTLLRVFAGTGSDGNGAWALTTDSILHFDGATWSRVGYFPGGLVDLTLRADSGIWIVTGQGSLNLLHGSAN